ncbi:MAG: hypothetical protein Ct9H300mP14_12860 [Gammaproteobacteria bacterium]|nr:MAG: hypothetical protein Ct9H300mP14_12860 [Gammaproteobacteria bacterium]
MLILGGRVKNYRVAGYWWGFWALIVLRPGCGSLILGCSHVDCGPLFACSLLMAKVAQKPNRVRIVALLSIF